jgi:hypothetical protein
MMILFLGACGGAAAQAPATAPAPQPTALTPAQIAEKALPSVVMIKTDSIIGTGFVVWGDGRIATNLHVIAGAQKAEIALADGRKFDQVEVLAVDQIHDLAVLRVPTTGLAALALGDSQTVKPGEHVVAIGNPLGLGNTISDGLISAVREVESKNLKLLQFTAPIAQGSSGGPILNERAEVIGIATQYIIEGQNLNFGVPVSYLRPMLLSEQARPLTSVSQTLDAALLDGCSIDEVKLAVTDIHGAIEKGAKMYNAGNHQGCYELYEKTALKVVGELKTCPGLRDTLLGGLQAASHAPDVSAKAWAMRHAFDRVLGAVTAAVKEQGDRP